MRIGSLFSGIEGFGLGFEYAGFAMCWGCEIEKNARSVWRKHYAPLPLYLDVAMVSGADIQPVDVLTFGSPCQDLSLAGKRAGLAGERSGLYHQAIRIIAEMREATNGLYPRFAIWENVYGALSSHGGRDFRTAMHALAEIGAVDIAWRVFDAQFFGVAQQRRRVFVVADFGGQCAGEVLFEPASVPGNTPSRRQTGEVVAAISASGVGTCGADDNQAQAGHLIARCLNANATERYDASVETFVVAHTLTASYASNYGRTAGNNGGVHNLLPVAFDCRNLSETGEIAHTLQSKESGGYSLNYQPIVFVPNGLSVALRGRDGGATAELGGEVATTLRASQGGGDKPYVLTWAGVRRLTPRECERLQGFPDDWTADGIDEKGNPFQLSDSARYRALGNAVCVNVVEWLGKRVRNVLIAEEA
jgi:DNA (cytosine-5)-methyltransferase 1